ncbi:3-hydroxyacyl-CoA dehydrogenase family protein [Planctomycetota bacterium]
MIDNVKNVVILGSSGTVGSLTGGLFAQQGIKVYFLSRTLQAAKTGLKKAISQARSEVISRYIECGDYDHMLENALQEADLVIESVSENLEIKRKIYQKVERYRKPDTIVGSTTSSLPLTALIEGRSESFKKNFLSTHFYNPPGKMRACEITGTEDTNPAVYDFMKDFLENSLDRVVIPVKNTPGFAGNRIAFVLFNRITSLVEDYGVEMMDYLIGPYTGRLMPPLATIDLVGIDIHKAIIRSLQENTHDEMHESLVLPDYIDRMIDEGLLGNKTKAGFYKKLESGKRMFFDPATCDYVPAIEPHVAFVEKAKSLTHLGMYREAFDSIRSASSREAEIVLEILCMYIAYSYSLIGEVTDKDFGIGGIDKVMSYGFNWAGPSVIVNMLGGIDTVTDLFNKKGLEVPAALVGQNVSEEEMVGFGKYFIAY